MTELLAGGAATASIIAAMFFLRFWATTRDRFFMYFALSFLLEGLNRVALILLQDTGEASPVHYIMRLVAFSLILMAIWNKNRGPAGRHRKADQHPSKP